VRGCIIADILFRGDDTLRIHLSVLARSGSGDHVAVKAIKASTSVDYVPAPVIIKTDTFRTALRGSGYDTESMLVQLIPTEGRELCLEVSEAVLALLTSSSLD
jgi:hypothetical protein